MCQTLYRGLHVIQSMAIQRGGPQPHLIDRETEAGVHSVRGSGHAAWNWPSWISDPPVFHSEAWTGLPSKPFLPVLDHGLTPWTVPSRAGVTVHPALEGLLWPTYSVFRLETSVETFRPWSKGTWTSWRGRFLS